VADTEKLLRLIKQADLQDNQIIQKLVKTAVATDNEYRQKQIQKIIETKAAQQVEYPFTVPNTAAPWKNTVKLGYTPTGSTYTIKENKLTQHLLTAGQTGSGKTTLFLNLKDQLSVPWWSFDFKKDYRHLAKKRDDVIVLTPEQIKVNPLNPPPGRNRKNWLSSFVETFCDSQMLLGGSERFLDKHATHYVNKNDDVSLLGLKNYIENQGIHPSQQQFQKRVADSIGSIIRDVPGLSGSAESKLDLEQLLEHRVVFELDEQKSKTQNFIIEYLMAWVYEYRKAQNQRTGDLRHVFFIDESKEIFSVYKERNTASGNPVIALKLAKLREFGEGVVAADQEAGKLMNSLKANTKTKIMLPAGDRREFEALAESLHLNEMQEQWAQNLDVGQAIIQVGNQSPVPVLLDDFKLVKDVDDDTLVELQKQHWLKLGQPYNQLPGKSQEREEERDTAISGPENPETNLSDDEEAFIENIVRYPFKPLSKRYELYSSTGKGYRVKDSLVENDLIKEVSISSPSRSRKLFEITGQGRETLENLGIEVSWKGRGGVEHRYWQHRLKKMMQESGWTAELEKDDADVYGVDGETEIVVEVAMDKNQREVEHVESHVEAGFDKVVVGCRSKSVKRYVEEKASERGVDTEAVEFHVLHKISAEEFQVGE